MRCLCCFGSLRCVLFVCVLLSGVVACGDDEVFTQKPWSIKEKPNIEDLEPKPDPKPDPKPEPKPEPEPEPEPEPKIEPIPPRLLGYWGGGAALGGCIEHTFFQHFDPQSDAFTFAFLNNNACVQPDERGMFLCEGTYRIAGNMLVTTCQSADGALQQQTAGTVMVHTEGERQVFSQHAFARDNTVISDYKGWVSQYTQETVGPWPGNKKETKSHQVFFEPLPDMHTLVRGDTFSVRVRLSLYMLNEYEEQSVVANFVLTATVTSVTSSGQVRAVLYPPDAQNPREAFRKLLVSESGQSEQDVWYMLRVMPASLIWEPETPDRLGGTYFHESVVPQTWSNLTDPCTDYDYFYMALKPFEQWCSNR